MAAKKILWVEDDDDLVEALQPQLEREGWAVHRIDSAKAMAAKVAEVHPDAIVMDIIMPGEHGFSATEDLKGRDDAARIPVIVYTSVRA
jgi:DNA-binding response OmpR family regulator